MLKIIDGRIYMRRGDDEVLDVNLSMGEEARQMQEGEKLTLTVCELPGMESTKIFSSSSTGAKDGNRIIINHADTANAEPGEYSADVQLTTADGKRKTVWPDIDVDNPPKANSKNWKNFVILPEVTME